MANTLNKITTKSILDATVATADIADDAVTEDKLANAINTSIAGKAVLTGSTNNTITTVTGANAIQGEANLTFDGDTLRLTETSGDSADGAQLDLKFGNNNSTDVISSVTFSNGAGEAARIQGETSGANNSGVITFHTDNAGTSAERLRIDSSGNVGLGTASPTSALHLSKSGGSAKIELQRSDANTTGNVGIINFTASDGHSVANMGAFGDGDNEGAYLSFQTTSAAAQNSPFESGTTERLRIQSGGGISFNGDSAADNALDDYEEGTFTPTWGHNGSAESGFTYQYQYGFYTKVGNMCHVTIWINTTGNTNTSASDVLQLNLPFASRNNSGYRGGMTYTFNGMNAADAHDDSDDQVIRTHINYNVAWMEVGFASNLNGAAWQTGAFTTGSIINGDAGIQLSGTYQTA